MKIVAVAVASLFAVPALAHIELTDPPNRYASTGLDNKNKECPCGFHGTGATPGTQTCSGGITSDAHRSTNHVTTYAAGQQVTVTWIENIDHSGRMRVAFDSDGADLADFNAHIILDVADPATGKGKDCTVNANTGNATCTVRTDSTWTATFTLPNTPCTNCTLQVIQDMSGDTTDPVANPTGDDTYFQCADLILTGAGGEGEGEGEGGAGEGEGAAGEGEGAAGEGEGAAAGEGEGAAAGEGEGAAAGEGEGAAAGEGEGAAAGEGEGAAAGEGEGAAAGEGEGEGGTAQGCPGCASAGDAHALIAVGLAGLALVRRRRGAAAR